MIYQKVAIIGRPNVGKSSLFNRILKKRSAIVSPQPGVTRDRHEAFVYWESKKFLLIDTGGLEPSSSVIPEKSGIQRLMQEQIDLALASSDILLFVLDGKEGLHPTDEEILDLLRRKEKKIFFVINKMDDPTHENRVLDFYKLGVDSFYPVSAEHNLGVGDLLDDVASALSSTSSSVILSETKDPQEKIEEEVRIAIVGRPNVGKSTLVNKLLGENRCIVSPEALTTRDAIDTYLIKNNTLYTLVDTAGIRRRGKVDTPVEFYSVNRSQKAILRADVIFLVIDGEAGVVEQDASIANFVVESGASLMILVNKWDLVEKDTKTAQKFEKDFRYFYPNLSWVPLIFISALTGQRVSKLLNLAVLLLEERRKKVESEELEFFLQKKLEELPPPVYRGRRPRFFGLSQIDVAPPFFYFKVKPAEGLKDSYKQYLQNGLREEFGFKGTPLRLVFKKSLTQKPYHN